MLRCRGAFVFSALISALGCSKPAANTGIDVRIVLGSNVDRAQIASLEIYVDEPTGGSTLFTSAQGAGAPTIYNGIAFTPEVKDIDGDAKIEYVLTASPISYFATQTELDIPLVGTPFSGGCLIVARVKNASGVVIGSGASALTNFASPVPAVVVTVCAGGSCGAAAADAGVDAGADAGAPTDAGADAGDGGADAGTVADAGGGVVDAGADGGDAGGSGAADAGFDSGVADAGAGADGGADAGAGASTGWLSVGAGRVHACALKGNGELWCWGANFGGQLGDGTTVDRYRPTYVDAGTAWVSVAVAGDHTCGIMDGGTLWCWGYNYNGQLGLGSTVDKNVPTQVEPGTTWTNVAGGSADTCGIRSEGTLWCWGLNSNGNIGNPEGGLKFKTPTYVDAGAGWASVVAGEQHNCGAKVDGTLWCWGYDSSGQLGAGSPTATYWPNYVDAGTNWVSLNLGRNHSCGTKADGTLWCWGNNTGGQLGDGMTINRNLPRIIDAGATWVRVSAGGGNNNSGYTCGTKSDGTLWCWGSNYYGELGDGTMAEKHLPTFVDAGTDWATLGAGDTHTCGTKGDGTLWCWGHNAWGQLGDGTDAGKTTPTPVP